MTLVTLLGKRQAKKGNEFTYGGPVSDCRECKIKTVCFNLKQGKRYRVVEVREKTHKCNIHDKEVQIVEVEEVPTEVVLSSKLAIEGSTVTFEECNCKNVSCEHYSKCHPWGIQPGTKVTVVKDKGKVDCSEGMSKKLVDIK